MANTCITSVCSVCSTAFAPQYRWSVYCTTECAKQAKQARRQRALAKLRERGDVWAKAQAHKREARRAKAERDGRAFRPSGPGGKGRAAGYAKTKPPLTAEEEARKAWRDWVKRAPAWWKAAAQKARDGLGSIKGGGDPDALRSRWRKAKHDKRARLRGASDGSLSREGFDQLYDQATDCIYCGCALTRRQGPTEWRSTDATLDHLRPLSRGGVHGTRNVVIACAKCNFSKGASSLARWLKRIAPARADAVATVYRSRFGADPA